MFEVMLPKDDKGIREISNSEIQTFKQCRRKWWLKYSRGLRRRDELPISAMATGTRIHSALEHYYQSECDVNMLMTGLELAIEQDKNRIVEMLGGGFLLDAALKTFVKAANLERAMVQGYSEWIQETGADSTIEVIGTELKLSYPCVMNFGKIHLIGKIDILVKDYRDGRVYIIDTKTCASFEQFTKTAHISEQPKFYQYLAQHTLPDEQHASGAIFNLLKKVGRTARAKPPFYMRHTVHNNPQTISSLASGLPNVLNDIRKEETRGVHYPSPTGSCVWTCPFFAICHKFDDGYHVEELLAEQYTVSDPNSYYGTTDDHTD